MTEQKKVERVIALDGKAASGKGTIGLRLAHALDFAHLDTGLLYRGVTLAVITAQGDHTNPEHALSAAKALCPTLLTSGLLHSSEIDRKVGIIAAMPEVRKELYNYQRNFPAEVRWTVMDGRDIGTKIFPDAPLKFFIDARPEIRAARSVARLTEAGKYADFDRELASIIKRDRLDAERPDSPMKPAADAVIIDTSEMNKDQAYYHVLRFAAKRFAEIALG